MFKKRTLNSRPPLVTDVAPTPPEQQTSRASLRPTKTKRLLLSILAGGLLLLAGVGVSYWWFKVRQPSGETPFTAQVMASVQFPLYYPTKLPAGYHIDRKSINEPQKGVVIFTMIGPKGAKAYVSEEARPASFNFGDFYNELSNTKKIGVSDGTIAVGNLKNSPTEVASRTNNKTWIISNNNARIPRDQLIAMMRSLTVSY